jgi:hypothetical protein
MNDFIWRLNEFKRRLAEADAERRQSLDAAAQAREVPVLEVRFAPLPEEARR